MNAGSYSSADSAITALYRAFTSITMTIQMEKKTCKNCGKTWIIERFDGHPCPVIPKKPRTPRAKRAGTKTDEGNTKATDNGPPLVSFHRIS
jgi:hypothetical protein